MEPIIVKHLTGSKSGQMNFFELAPNEELTIGRDPANKLAFHQKEDDVVGRKHAKIYREGEEIVIVDLFSRNGTFVNGTRISSPTRLRPGDVVELGAGGPKVQFYKGYDSLSGPATRLQLPDVPKSPPTRMTSKGVLLRAQAGGRGAGGPQEEIVLRHIRGSKAGQSDVYEIGLNDEVSVGRDPTNSLMFHQKEDDLVGRKHAKIVRQADEFVIVDLNSHNGTFVNEERVAGTRRLKTGDVIEFGAGGPRVQFFRGSESAAATGEAKGGGGIGIVGAGETTGGSPDLSAIHSALENIAEPVQSQTLRNVMIGTIVLFFAIGIGIGLSLAEIGPDSEEAGSAAPPPSVQDRMLGFFQSNSDAIILVFAVGVLVALVFMFWSSKESE